MFRGEMSVRGRTMSGLVTWSGLVVRACRVNRSTVYDGCCTVAVEESSGRTVERA
jgi:hypothetical protein